MIFESRAYWKVLRNFENSSNIAKNNWGEKKNFFKLCSTHFSGSRKVTQFSSTRRHIYYILSAGRTLSRGGAKYTTKISDNCHHHLQYDNRKKLLTVFCYLRIVIIKFPTPRQDPLQISQKLFQNLRQLHTFATKISDFQAQNLFKKSCVPVPPIPKSYRPP